VPDRAAISLFIIGILGGIHCIGMCGGIVGALDSQHEKSRVRRSIQHLTYNAGRILSYCIMGGIAGAMGQASFFLVGRKLAPFHYLLANLMLVALGLYLMGIPRFIAPFECAGAILWKKLQPLTGRLLPARTLGQLFAVGVVWGWLPCGLVYSALATALTAASVTGGAYLMLAFGLGTLPNLLLAGMMAAKLNKLTKHPFLRYAGGSAVIILALYGIFKSVGKIIT
jgi:uncharacterized protein